MATHLPQNQFISHSVVAPVSTDTADASSAPPLSGASADLSNSSALMAFITEDTAVALSRTSVLDAQTDAAAEPIQSSCNPDVLNADDGRALGTLAADRPSAGSHETEAAASVRTAAASDISNIKSSCGLVEARERWIDQASVIGVQFPLINRTQLEVAPSPQEATNHIHEIFHYVRKLFSEGSENRFVLNEREFMDAIDEEPLFLREDGYLQRREA